MLVKITTVMQGYAVATTEHCANPHAKCTRHADYTQRGCPVAAVRLAGNHTRWQRRKPPRPHGPHAHKLAASPKAFCFFSPGMAPSSTAWVTSDGSANPSDR